MDFIRPDDIQINMFELLTTENCNQKCTYCFDNYFSERKNDPSTFMPVKMIPDIISFVEKVRDHKKSLIFHYIGGEPVLNRKFLVESVEALKDKYYPMVEFGMNTNLTILDDELITLLVDNGFYLTISLDGTKKSHNSHRQNWDLVMKNLVILNSAYVDKYGPNHRRISVNDVVSCDTTERIEEDCKFLFDLHIPVSLGINNEDNWDDEKFALYKANSYKVAQKYGLKNIYFSKMGLDRLKQPDRKHFCLRNVSNVTINPQGKLFFCHRLTPKSYTMGEDFKYYYGDIWNGYTTDYYKLIGDIITQKHIKEPCKSCEILHYCNTGCLAAHFVVNNDYNTVSENACKTMKIWYEITMDLTEGNF